MTRRYCPRDMTCKRCFYGQAWLLRTNPVSSTFIGWRTGSHFELAYHQIAHCTYLLVYCLSIRLAPITHFLLTLLTRNSCHLHCILSSAHIATHIGSCTLHYLAQREFEAQGKIPIVPLSDLQVGSIYIGHMIATI